MTTDPRLSSLIDRWALLQEQGRAVSVAELCADCPELADDLQREVEAREARRVFEETHSDTGTPSTPAPTDSRNQATGVYHPPIAAWPHLPGYEVLGEIGRGGMGVVYKARQIGLNRLVAIKMNLTGSRAGPRERARFHAEAEAVARLHHSNIVQIYEINEHEGASFFSMEYVEGESLLKRLNGQPAPASEAAQLVETLARAMHYAHQRGVIHRDLKPANILLAGTNDVSLGDALPKITDFGLAKQLAEEARLTQTGAVLGTLCYMAPEQIDTSIGPISPLVDVYGLGSVLYETLTGIPPFDAPTDYQVMQRVVNEDPVPPSQVQEAVPAALDAICLKCLSKNPVDRYASAEELADDLFVYLTGEQPIAASRGSNSGAKRPTHVPRSGGSSAIRLRMAERAAKDQARKFRRRAWLVGAGSFAVGALVGGRAVLQRMGVMDDGKSEDDLASAVAFSGPPIKVGILHSLTGTISYSAAAVVDATRLAIDELNAAGGVLGRKVDYVMADGTSDERVFARKAEQLISTEQVATIFGCWTSSSRKAVRPVVEKHDHLLMYPVDYEGLEDSPNIVYLGSSPNQQIIPAVQWAYAFLKRRKFFLVGSDYIFPRAANAILGDELKDMGAKVVGEEYIPLGETEVESAIAKIAAAEPDMILNTINGDSNVAFFRELRHRGITPQQIPTLSFSIGEQELLSMRIEHMVGDYVAASYFQSIDRPENKAFVARFRERYGPQRVTTAPMEAAYSGVHLWAQAVRSAGSDEPKLIRHALSGQRYNGPGGEFFLEPKTLNSYRYARVGRVQPTGQFEVVYTTPSPVAPEDFPDTRTRAQWEVFLKNLYDGWKGNWAPV